VFEIERVILDCDGIALHVETFLSKGFELHASKRRRSG
jgi:hypothetical protein